ncbi:uncharacterized protein LOC120118218 [Hibiscus syriacus]|uniref:uncharacterized protein LOC120118218 n=1 Tax=Hibiscus syriacus TaxID=106335 RepID=UPI0019218AF3|nr:uncharacterized protein LOC120118218 [Hibiscus syriacus]
MRLYETEILGCHSSQVFPTTNSTEREVLKMKASEPTNEYFARTLTIANKMKANGENKSDEEVAMKILKSMTPKFNYVMCDIEESDTSTLSIDELKSSLLVHEQRINITNLIEETHALKISTGARYEGKVEVKEAIEEKVGDENDKTQEDMLLMAFVDTHTAAERDTWFLDSGCSNHMCGKKDYFMDLDEDFRDTVKLGNNSNMTVMGKGNVRLQIHGVMHILTGVFYIPQLKNKLLSIVKLQEKGLAVLFQHDRCKVYHSER